MFILVLYIIFWYNVRCKIKCNIAVCNRLWSNHKAFFHVGNVTCQTYNTRYCLGSPHVTYFCPYVVRWTWGRFQIFPWVQSYLCRGLGMRYSPQVHSHHRSTAPSHRTGTSSPVDQPALCTQLFNFPVYIQNKGSLIEVSQRETCVLQVWFFHSESHLQNYLQSLSTLSHFLSHLLLFIVDEYCTSKPPPLCDVSTDPKHKHPKTNPIPNILTLKLHL